MSKRKEQKSSTGHLMTGLKMKKNIFVLSQQTRRSKIQQKAGVNYGNHNKKCKPKI